MATIGTVIVEMRANAAQFTAETERAGESVRKLGGHASNTNFQIARFAAIGAQSMIPALDGMRVALEQGLLKIIPLLTPKIEETTVKLTALQATIQRLQAANLAATLAPIGPALAVIAAALAGFALGNIIANFRDLQKEGHGYIESLKLSIGLTKSYSDRLKESVEEEKKFNDELKKTAAFRENLAKQLNALKGDVAISSAKLAGDDEGEVRATLDARLQAIEDESQARKRSIVEQFKDEERRREFLRKNDEIVVQERNKAFLDSSIQLKAIDQKRTDEQFKTWQAETENLKAQLDIRVKAQQEAINQTITAIQGYVQKRKALEDSIGKGGVAGSGVTQGFGAVKDLQSSVGNEIQQIALLTKQGALSPQESVQALQDLIERTQAKGQAIREEFSKFPAVIRQLDAVLRTANINDFVTQLINAKDQLEAEDQAVANLTAQLVAQNQALVDMVNGGMADYQLLLAQIPAGVKGAEQAVNALTQKFREYTAAVNESNVAVATALQLAAAGGGQ